VNLERWVAPSRLEKVVYVSCNPGTFASDAARLIRMGFVLQEVGIFDMFPHTAHVETLGLFERVRVPAHG
jgi:23S rRNA (uracil1939-C5)-methyltransferase